MNITLLGPQGKEAAAKAAVAELIPEGPIAVVNPGWQERETDPSELDQILDGRMINLELYRRWIDVRATDPKYAAAERTLTENVAEMQALYGIRLGYALDAIKELLRRSEVTAAQTSAIEDAFESVRILDQWHLDRVAVARQEFYETVRLGEHDLIMKHRAEIHEAASNAAGLVFTGGHVGVLLQVLHIFAIRECLGAPMIAWSAGAMTLSDRVVVLNNRADQGFAPAEVYAEGLGAFVDVLPFPDAGNHSDAGPRLIMNDAQHQRLMAERFKPRNCLLLADGQRVDLRDNEPLPPGARFLSAEGIEQVPAESAPVEPVPEDSKPTESEEPANSKPAESVPTESATVDS